MSRRRRNHTASGDRRIRALGKPVRRERIGQMFRGLSAFAEFCRNGQHKLYGTD